MKRLKFKRACKIKVGANKDYTEKKSNLSWGLTLVYFTNMHSLLNKTLLANEC